MASKLSAFIDEHRPVDATYQGEQIFEVVTNVEVLDHQFFGKPNGLRRRPSMIIKRALHVLSWDRFIPLDVVKLEITWSSQTKGDQLVFTPIAVVRDGSGTWIPLEKSWVKLLPVVVTLPEQVVPMPVPVWVEGGAYAESGYWMEGQTVFLSEARQMADEFRAKLAELGL